MTRVPLLIFVLAFLAACDSGGGDVLQDPNTEDTTTGAVDPTDDGDSDNAIDSDRELPPGTLEPTADSAITRREPLDADSGGGYARNIEYRNDQRQDEFFVDNIAFDGNNVYVRGGSETSVNALASLGEFGVYEGAETTQDPVTGEQIGTFTYRAVYGRSDSGATEFAIVRSGSYINYGFGGFIYQRNDAALNGDPVQLILPDEGDARYLGDYAGIRIFDGRGGLEYVQGDAEMIVDFKDFNNGNRGVALFVNNRRLFDIDGNDITQDYLNALSANGGGANGGLLGNNTTGAGQLVIETDGSGNPVLPVINPFITPTIADSNGEIVGDVFELSTFEDANGVRTSDETGNGTYYAVLSGDNAEEVVGVLVLEGDDPRVDGTTFQETGGFILYRN